MTTLKLTVNDSYIGVRADAYISAVTDLSRTAAARLCEEGQVTIGGKPIGKKTTLSLGDTLEVVIPDPTPTAAVAEDIPLDILYEDDDLLVINKPVGMVVHPAAGNTDGTLVNALLHHCGDSLSGIGGELRPGIVHRIDKDTSGLLVVAKNDKTHRALSDALAVHAVRRVYFALVNGGFSTEGGTIDAPIGRHPVDRKRMAVLRDGKGKEAVTHYEVLARYGAISYLKVQLETGRTHQIRVRMASIGHPLLGDTVYGGGNTRFEKVHSSLMQGQCLHAGELSFTHPTTGEEMHFVSPLPPYFEKLLNILETST